MRLLERLVDMGDVADAKGDRVGIERAIAKGQVFGILLRPDQALISLLLRALDPDGQHFGIDVRHSHLRAMAVHTERDVARSAGHVENLLTGLRLHAADELVLP